MKQSRTKEDESNRRKWLWGFSSWG